MAPFKFGKKKSKPQTGNNTINGTDSSNDTADLSRPSISSTNSQMESSPEQIFKKKMKSNMLNPQGQSTNNHTTQHNNNSHFNGLRFFSSSSATAKDSGKGNKVQQSPQTYNDTSTHWSPEANGTPQSMSYQKYRAASGGSVNALNSPFSLQSPSFTIVANNNKTEEQNSHLAYQSNLSKGEINPMADISQLSDMAQQSTGLWLTEDDLFALKPWDRVKLPISPFPRYRHTASNVSITVNNNDLSANENTSISSDIYVIGGLYGQSVYGDTWKLRFTRTKVNNADILDNFDQSDSKDKVNKLYKLHCNTSSIKISEQTPPPRVGHASVMCGNAFIVFGGDTHKLNQEGLMDDDLYLFNINTKKWTIPSPIGKRPKGRYGHKICVIQQNEILTRNITASTKLFLFGGQFDDNYFNDLYSFDLSSFRREDSHWDHIKPLNFSPPPMTNHVMCTFDNKLWIFGGETPQGLLNDVFMYDPILNDWEIVKTTANATEDGVPPPMQEHSCVVYKNLMCVYGGKDSEENYLNDLWFFNFMTKKWFKFPKSQNQIIDKVRENKVSPNCFEYQPIGRSGHSMTLLQKENKLLIMGGDKFDYNTNTDLNDVFAVENDVDISVEDSSAHVFGTTVYTFDLTCLKSFIPNIFDIKDVKVNSALDLLDVAEDNGSLNKAEGDTSKINIGEEDMHEAIQPHSEQSLPLIDNSEHKNSVKEQEITSTEIVQSTSSEPIKLKQGSDTVEKNSTITINRNSFPLLSQLKAEPLVTPTDTAFSINTTGSVVENTGERVSTSNPSQKENTGVVSDFFDTYNDDESSVQLRNSINSGHLLISVIKNANGNSSANPAVIDHDIIRSEEDEGLSNLNSYIFENHESKDMLLEDSGISSAPTTTQNNLDENVIFKQPSGNTGSSHTFTEENNANTDISNHHREKTDEIEAIDLSHSDIPRENDVEKTEHTLTENVSEFAISGLEKSSILEEILKLREETMNAAKSTSDMLNKLEKEVNLLRLENAKLKDEQDYLNLQIDELNMKNMELLNAASNQNESKQQIFTALKLALSQIEKAHL